MCSGWKSNCTVVSADTLPLQGPDARQGSSAEVTAHIAIFLSPTLPAGWKAKDYSEASSPY
jgi:hypothetical protein